MIKEFLFYQITRPKKAMSKAASKTAILCVVLKQKWFVLVLGRKRGDPV